MLDRTDSQAKPPGFHFATVALDRLSVTDIKPNEILASLKFFFDFRRAISMDPPVVEVTVIVRIRPPEETDSQFNLEAEITGRFERTEGPNVLSLEEFAKLNGPALVMPYARELVTNVTARTRHGPIIFPPVNIVALVLHGPRSAENAPQSDSSESAQ